MDPKAFVDTRMKRSMALTLEEFEEKVQRPLQQLQATLAGEGITGRRLSRILEDADDFKRVVRKRFQAFAADCADLMPSDVEINAFEPVRRSA